MASVLGFDKKYGVKIVPTKEASWAGVRDKLVNGELDMAHVLYGLIYGVHLGIGGPKKDMAMLMTLNHNGQAITLSKKLADKGAVDGASLAKLMADGEARIHLRADLPDRHARDVALLLAGGVRHQPVEGRQDHHRAAAADGRQHARRQHGRLLRRRAVGPPRDHRRHRHHRRSRRRTSGRTTRRRCSARTAEFVKKNPNTCRAVMMAVLEAGRWIDASLQNKKQDGRDGRRQVATSTPASTRSTSASSGRYQNGLGKTWDDPNHMKFFNDGAVNFPYLSDGMWFLTQHKRWGLLKEHPDYLAVAKQVNQIELYKQAAAAAKITVPKDAMRTQQADRRRGLGRQGPEEVRRRRFKRAGRPEERAMVSAVFHSPLDAAQPTPRRRRAAARRRRAPRRRAAAPARAGAAQPRRRARRRRLQRALCAAASLPPLARLRAAGRRSGRWSR